MKILNTNFLKAPGYPHDLDPNSVWSEVIILTNSENNTQERYLIKSTIDVDNNNDIIINETFNLTTNSVETPVSSIGVLFQIHLQRNYIV